jgi:hypothetical protein
MTPRIQSRSGTSLADIYDVVGSIFGIEELEARELGVFHELGGTVFSERFSCVQRVISALAVPQSTAISVVLTDLPREPTRLMGVTVVTGAGDGAKLDRCNVNVRDPLSGVESVVWTVDGSTVQAVDIDLGVGVAARDMLVGVPSQNFSPTFIGGIDQPHPNQASSVALRGLTNAFGAGTIGVFAILYLAFALPAGSGISSYGLPLPSW